MSHEIPPEHPLRSYFRSVLDHTLHEALGLPPRPDVTEHLEDLLVRFSSLDNVYGIRDRAGRSVRSIAEMLLEGDVRFRADSFRREREVHRHIGDLLLFGTGLFPEFVRDLKADSDPLLDPVRQGQESYYVVSTFAHPPYEEEAPRYRVLSDDFDLYRRALSHASRTLGFA